MKLIYISRSKIPGSKNNNDKISKYFKQVCIYAFNNVELRKFYQMKKKVI